MSRGEMTEGCGESTELWLLRFVDRDNIAVFIATNVLKGLLFPFETTVMVSNAVLGANLITELFNSNFGDN